MRWRCSVSACTRPGSSATTSNGRSWHPSSSGFTRSGTTATASACPQLADPPRPHHSPPVGIPAVADPLGVPAARRRCFGCLQRPPRAGRRTPAMLTTPQLWYRRSADSTRPRRRGCQPTRCTLNACMRGATECRVSRRRPIPLVIRASCRAPRLIMGVLKPRDRDHPASFIVALIRCTADTPVPQSRPVSSISVGPNFYRPTFGSACQRATHRQEERDKS